MSQSVGGIRQLQRANEIDEYTDPIKLDVPTYEKSDEERKCMYLLLRL